MTSTEGAPGVGEDEGDLQRVIFEAEAELRAMLDGEELDIDPVAVEAVAAASAAASRSRSS